MRRSEGLEKREREREGVGGAGEMEVGGGDQSCRSLWEVEKGRLVPKFSRCTCSQPPQLQQHAFDRGPWTVKVLKARYCRCVHQKQFKSIIMTSSSLPAAPANTSDIYASVDNYPWDDDREFQAGLSAILGSNSSPEQTIELELRARCFYYSRQALTTSTTVISTS
jgi:hypothetical protein